ncbi:MAG: Uncharacterized protein XD67_1181 [Thermodesulfobacterium commune]|uniref:TIGR00153 family protein n=1 Tax=Thermodesulfobacterium commune TaxID=1741 RepID=A0A101FI84_9BACT|nr:MAG: Uncharacterized protein XD67_1181 [Thermodesulfobacterium commune]HAA84268.1 TIGR00153 family protein [Thermodesulfobacterium commune]
MLEKLLGGGKLEKKAITQIQEYLKTLCAATECLKETLLQESFEQTYCIENFEREADSLKREIIGIIYEGAFLPYIRPNLCNFIEIVEKAFDHMKVCAFEYRYILNSDLYGLTYKNIEEECLRIAHINVEMCQILIKSFEALWTKDNIREKNLAIRILEKKVDEIKLELTEKIRNCKLCKITNYWEGKIMSDFVDALVSVSDVIEDASDYLYLLDLSLR